MLELVFLKSALPVDTDLGKANKKGLTIAIIVLLLYIVIWVWALSRAVACTPSTKVMHVFFAANSPLLYLLFSYFSKNFCKQA